MERTLGCLNAFPAPGASPPHGIGREKMKANKFPSGWDEQRVRKVLEHYETQT